jgi:hypothetical protein
MATACGSDLALQVKISCSTVMKNRNEQDDNDYKPIGGSEGDEKEAIKWMMSCRATN